MNLSLRFDNQSLGTYNFSMFRLLFTGLLFSLPSLACDQGMFQQHFLQTETNSLTEEKFRATLKDFQQKFVPEVKQKHKAQLLVYGQWTSDTINAYAERDMDAWIITIYGGMARHKELTIDGLQLILCHELGHHLGGAPKKGTNRWSSAEGQADYFATMKCLRKWWKEETWIEPSIPDYVIAECAQSYSTQADQRLCQRISLVGLSVAKMFQALHQEALPRFETPDTNQVSRTNPLHSNAQCRLDTYFQGALCPVSEGIDFTYADEKMGACHPLLGDDRGIRPGCWYATRTERL